MGKLWRDWWPMAMGFVQGLVLAGVIALYARDLAADRAHRAPQPGAVAENCR
jgi:hypothetical protein